MSQPYRDVAKQEFEHSVLDRFEEHVRKYPDRLAFKTKRDALTWDALNRNANRVARAVLGACESRERAVALLLDQATSIMAATMGVLKTGGFYVSLNPSHPSARNSYILNDTEAALIVTNSKTFPRARELVRSGCRLLNIDELDSSLSTENLGYSISPDSIAYIAYTSGSTGEPKGLVSPHRKLLHRSTHTKGLELGPDDRYTNAGSVERNLLIPLLSGAGSFPWNVKEEGLADLADWLIQEEITVYRCVPTVFRHFVDTLTGEEEFPKLRLIILTGEPVYRSDIELYKRHFSSDCLLVVSYGTRETGSISRHVIDKETNVASEIVPVGYVLEGQEVLLLDDNGKPVGFNEVGEIALKSRHLSLGYWRRPELTQAKFLPDPDGGDQQIYLTGDLGRMTPDGCLEHLGRKDFQVKIRGLRVEVSEVEGALRSMGAIREAVVVTREDNPGGPSAPLRTGKRLVAYIVRNPEATVGVSEIRSFMRKKLPDYMIPSAFVFLDALPLMPNGKVNLRALPAPDQTRPELGKPFVAPGDTLELQLAKIWEKLLDIRPVGVTDNFFDLGGHSLLAARLFAQIEKATGRNLPLVTLFQAPTIEQLAHILRHENWEPPWSSLVPIQPGGSKPPFFGVHAHEGNILFYRDLARRLGSDQPFYGLQAQGLDGKQAPYSRVEEMAAHYVKEIRALQPKGPYFLGGYCFGSVVAFEMARQLHAQGERIALLAVFDAYAPGYRKLSPKSTSFRDSFHYFVRKVRPHLSNLVVLGPKEKLDYIKGRMAYWFYTGKGLPLPRTRRAILNAMSRASRNYRPQVYQGRVTLFQGGRRLTYDQDPQLGWGKLAAGGVEIHRIPSYDGTIFLEPHVRLLAEKLAACLTHGSASEQLASDAANHGQSTSQ